MLFLLFACQLYDPNCDLSFCQRIPELALPGRSGSAGMFYCRRPAVKLTCLPHFQSGPRMTRDPTPSIVKREGRAAAATFVGPAGPTSSMLAVDEVLAQAIVSRVHWNLVSSGRNNNLRDGFCHHYYRALSLSLSLFHSSFLTHSTQ